MRTQNKRIKLLCLFLMTVPALSYTQVANYSKERASTHQELPDDSYLQNTHDQRNAKAGYVKKGASFFTIQVNVNASGGNILGDAANEPSLGIDPTNPDNMVIGWRQFDNINSNFRQAGYGYTSDAGQSWTFPGVIEPGVFRSDPVLDSDSDGNIYYNSLTANGSVYSCQVFKSSTGGAIWDPGVDANGGDKQWMVIDKTDDGVGEGNIYSFWTSYYSMCYPDFFTRSIDGGNSFENCEVVDGNPYWGTMAVGPDGELYIVGAVPWDGLVVVKSTTAQNPGFPVYWDFDQQVEMDGYLTMQVAVNPAGLLGQAYIDVDRSEGPGRGNVYVLASMARISTGDPGDVMFARSTDGGQTWSAPLRINDNPGNYNIQWFGTMSVAPNGRIDAVWLDTRDALPGTYFSSLYYSFSDDQGESWSVNQRLSDAFDPHLGWPQQDKMGDYFDMESDETSAHLAWANTFNGEQDVYYGHIIPQYVAIEDPEKQNLLSLTNYPNPFVDQTTIRYTIPSSSQVILEIIDICGQVIHTLISENQQAGLYSIDIAGDKLTAGYYFCRLRAGAQSTTTRIVKIN
ncbi:MAG: T9SS type A sorting domain-containing protein [Bacteroidetes bacterium]|nr:T9SS type A sorting domain-containing protein [Bacteroidota bacterium]